MSNTSLSDRLRRVMVNGNKRLLGALRSDAADTVVDLPVAGRGFEGIRGEKHCLVVTYRKDGTPIPQPVWPGYEGDKMFVWTEHKAFKARRVRNNPDALIAPCSFRGVPKHGPVPARGRVLPPGPESEHAERVIRSQWGWKRKLFERTSRPLTPVVYLEFVPA